MESNLARGPAHLLTVSGRSSKVATEPAQSIEGGGGDCVLCIGGGLGGCADGGGLGSRG